MADTDVAERSLESFNPFEPEALQCPHAGWALLRREAPIFQLDMPSAGAPVFMVTGRHELHEIARQPLLFSNHPVPTVWRWGEFEPEIAEAFSKCGRKVAFTLATSDPPETPEYRKIAEQSLNRDHVAELQPEIDAIIDGLLAKIPENEPFNFVPAFSVPLPLLVICLIMGVPYEDAEFIRHFSDEFTFLVDPTHPVERAAKAADTVADGYLYFERYMLQYQKEPANNLLSDIANGVINGRPITMEEALSMAHNLAIAGNETTRNALSSAMLRLASDKALFDKLNADRDLVMEFIEEMLRVDAPAATTARQAMADTEIAGVRIPKGSNLFMMWGSGSVDERLFPDTTTFDLDRANKRAHSTFGIGLHHCVGSFLARAELKTAVERWLDLFESVELAADRDDVHYEPIFGFRAIGDLPIRVKRRKV